jgi:hypothetical protein
MRDQRDLRRQDRITLHAALIILLGVAVRSKMVFIVLGEVGELERLRARAAQKMTGDIRKAELDGHICESMR